VPDAYVDALLRERRGKDHAFKTDPHSPIPRDERASFRGLAYFDPDPAYRVVARWEPAATPKPIRVQTSTGEVREYLDAGVLRMTLPVGEVALHGYEGVGDGLFVPFRDATSGKETYGAGRYLDLEAPHGEELVVDFNLAYNPYCAYSEAYSCPFPPWENWLKVPIRAGERSLPG
jgi:uncharacterized protein (DUF1684 family)